MTMIDRQKNIPSLRAIASPDRATSVKARESWQMWGIISEFVEASERLSEIRPAVSIFGSARTPAGTPRYELASRIARKLSDAGFAVLSGGGQGIMEAANKGAFGGPSLVAGPSPGGGRSSSGVFCVPPRASAGGGFAAGAALCAEAAKAFSKSARGTFLRASQ